MDADGIFESLSKRFVMVKDKDNVGIWRVHFESPERATEFMKIYGDTENATYIFHRQNWNPERYSLKKSWICQHSSTNKVKDSQRNDGCSATVSIMIKVVKEASMLFDDYLKRDPPLNGVVTVDNHHSHDLNSTENLKMLRVSHETKEMFTEYFNKGLTPSKAMRLHKDKLKIKNKPELLMNSSINPTNNQVQHLYKLWRKANMQDSKEPKGKKHVSNPDIQSDKSSSTVCSVTSVSSRSVKTAKTPIKLETASNSSEISNMSDFSNRKSADDVDSDIDIEENNPFEQVKLENVSRRQSFQDDFIDTNIESSMRSYNLNNKQSRKRQKPSKKSYGARRWSKTEDRVPNKLSHVDRDDDRNSHHSLYTGSIKRLRITTDDYPETLLTTTQLRSIRDAILDEMVRNTNAEPHFVGVSNEPGYLVLICADGATADWVRSTGSELRPWKGAGLKVVDDDDTPTSVAVGCFPNECKHTGDEILRYVVAQNKGLNAKDWKILHEIECDGITQLTLFIDPVSAGNIDDLSVFYKFGKVRLQSKKIKREEDFEAFPNIKTEPSNEE